jgi:GNAT superfamily N-acetyltransferase
MSRIRPCGDEEVSVMLDIINGAAQAYRGVIPPDQWHEPYMTLTQLRREIAAGVALWGCEIDGELAGVIGLQPVLDAALIRHAYVRPQHQRHGDGATLLAHVIQQSTRQRMLVGTWAAASWAIRFYQRHGFELAPPERTRDLLQTYWTIPERQIETSVVLTRETTETRPMRERTA